MVMVVCLCNLALYLNSSYTDGDGDGDSDVYDDHNSAVVNTHRSVKSQERLISHIEITLY